MRDIKFRAWDKKDQLMYYDVQRGIEFYDGSYYSFSSFLGLGNKDDYHVWELMQFTGLTDKNGVEIYEGDIVKTPMGRTTKIVFDYGKFEPIDASGEYGWLHNQLEVIGNIYQNKKLLK